VKFGFSDLLGRLRQRETPLTGSAAVAARSATANLRYPTCFAVRLTKMRRDLLLRAARDGAVTITEHARDRSHADRLRAAARALEEAGFTIVTRECRTRPDGRLIWWRLTMRLTPAGEALVARTRGQLEHGREVRWRRLRQTGFTLPPHQ
jgi:hypothetical protein